MLSYQHAYHAGNAADVHKHALLALALEYLVRKDKPISYIETHAGRGMYDLAGAESAKTGEARHGVQALLQRFAKDHPYRKAIEAFRNEHGPMAYPGSPLIAHQFKRSADRFQLAEFHPQEHTVLSEAMPKSGIHVYHEDGFPWAARICPPTPRRGLIFIDPSYELDHDFSGLPSFLGGLHKLWPVGVIMLWYPLLKTGEGAEMAKAIAALGLPKCVRHEVSFGAASGHHRLIGSGVLCVNAPYTFEADAKAVGALFQS
ncbi:MAG: 23S rRNA (adenine(2030)-N(6))-methyltransferase RlmJ [Pseudomonadota bacterium]